MANLLTPQEIMFTNFEPKMSNRFIMYIGGIPAYLIKAAGRPEIGNGKITIDHINTRRYIKGRSEWQDLTITLYDPVVPSAAQAVMEWVRLGHESVTGRNGYADFYKRDLQLKLLDPVGTVVELWDMKGCFLTDANFGSLDYSDDSGNMDISMTIRFDNCVLQY